MFEPDSYVEYSLLWRPLSYSYLKVNRDISILGSHLEFLLRLQGTLWFFLLPPSSKVA